MLILTWNLPVSTNPMMNSNLYVLVLHFIFTRHPNSSAPPHPHPPANQSTKQLYIRTVPNSKATSRKLQRLGGAQMVIFQARSHRYPPELKASDRRFSKLSNTQGLAVTEGTTVVLLVAVLSHYLPWLSQCLP